MANVHIRIEDNNNQQWAIQPQQLQQPQPIIYSNQPTYIQPQPPQPPQSLQYSHQPVQPRPVRDLEEERVAMSPISLILLFGVGILVAGIFK